jgi:hypothetical protein
LTRGRTEPDRAGAAAGERARARAAAVTIVGAMLAWFALTWLGGALGWPVALAFVFDLACLAALAWALYVLAGAWRALRRDEREKGH